MSDEQTPKRMRLYRSRWDDVTWTLRSGWFRASLAGVIVAALAVTAWWNWPTVQDAYDRTVAGWSEQVLIQPLPVPEIDTERRAAQAAVADQLERLIATAEGVIAAKRKAGVAKKHITPVVDLVADARIYLDADPILVAPVEVLAADLSDAIVKLSAAQPPPPPSNNSSGGSTGGSTSGGSTGGSGSNSGGGSSKTVTVSASVNCPSPGKVSATASGGGKVTVRISGAVSGTNSGSGSASVSVSGPSGTYTATATATGSVTITRLACG